MRAPKIIRRAIAQKKSDKQRLDYDRLMHLLLPIE